MSDNEEKKRIPELDAFRAIAILSVVLYHYYWRLTNITTFEGALPQSTGVLFNFGYLGVPFFFVISGFVIAATLGTSKTFFVFWKKRVVRLMPAMLLYSLISFVFFNIIEPTPLFERNASPVNLFYSLTFIHPDLLNVLFKPIGIHGTTLSGSYWSLWPEIQFYLLASFIYFAGKERFYTRFITTSVLLCGGYCLLDYLWSAGLLTVNENGIPEKLLYLFNIPRFIHWFLAGVLFHGLWNGKRDVLTWTGLMFCTLVMLQDMHDFKTNIYIFGFLGLFCLLIFRRNALRALQESWMVTVGVASYGLYLFHENVGLWLILHLGPYMGSGVFLLPILTAVLMVAFSVLLLKKFEGPLLFYLRNNWIRIDR